MKICGIDVGMNGGFCFLNCSAGETQISFHEMPTIEKELDLHRLANLFETMRDTRVFLEKVNAMPKNGAVSMFKFGRTYGALQAMCHAFRLSYTEVTPQKWQKEMHSGISKVNVDDPKKRSLIIAQRIFPKVNLLQTERSRVPHDGYVDALLIAEYGRRTIAGEIAKVLDGKS